MRTVPRAFVSSKGNRRGTDERTISKRMITTLYRSRWLIQALVVRDLVLRYRGTLIGFLWTLINPLLFVAVYTLVFSVYLKNPMTHFPLFVLSGLIPWQWFSTSVSVGTSSIVDGRGYVGKSVFRTPVLIFIPILSNFVNYLFFIPLLGIVALISHSPLGWPLVALPLLIAVQFILTTGLLFIAATFNVFFRDLQQLLTTILTIFFYLSPIFFTIKQIPAFLLPFTLANPVAGIILGYHNIFYYNTWPDFRLLGISLGIACAILWVGLLVFKRYEDALPDYL
jgi:ABC-type polysaccharide/polyol phosphate export permease